MIRFGLRAAGLAVVALVATSTTVLHAQQKLLTLDDLYDPVKKVNFGEPSVPRGGYTWLNDKEYLRVKDARTPQGPGFAIVRVDALTGTETPLFDQARLVAALSAVPGLSTDDAARAEPAARVPDERGPDGAGRQRRQRPVSLAAWRRACRAADLVCRGRGRSHLQPRRPARGLRARAQPVRRRSRRPRAATHGRRPRAAAERQAGLDLSGRDLRARHTPRLLVQPRLVAAGVSAARRSARPGVHRRRSHPVPAGR